MFLRPKCKEDQHKHTQISLYLKQHLSHVLFTCIWQWPMFNTDNDTLDNDLKRHENECTHNWKLWCHAGEAPLDSRVSPDLLFTFDVTYEMAWSVKQFKTV